VISLYTKPVLITRIHKIIITVRQLGNPEMKNLVTTRLLDEEPSIVKAAEGNPMKKEIIHSLVFNRGVKDDRDASVFKASKQGW